MHRVKGGMCGVGTTPVRGAGAEISLSFKSLSKTIYDCLLNVVCSWSVKGESEGQEAEVSAQLGFLLTRCTL